MTYSGKVAVLFGGIGSEREVSLDSGRTVADALTSAGIETIAADITPEDLSILDDNTIDAFFIMLHGIWGEDGQLQKILEQKGLTFTGSGSKASQLAFDKGDSKKAFLSAGLPTLPYLAVGCDSDWGLTEKELEIIGKKFVVKPACEGSSTGIEIAEGIDEAIAAAKKCTAAYGKTVIEKYVKAREFTVGVLAGEALPIIEIRTKQAFYDYNAKYIADTTEYLFDTLEDKKIAADMSSAALKCFEQLGCQGYARVDFLLTEDNKFYILEANTIPGFTSHSLLPKAAAKRGYSLPELCEKILADALNTSSQLDAKHLSQS